MSAVKIVPAAYRHVNRLARDMRPLDRLECRAVGLAPKSALRHGMLASAWARTVLLDGEPIAMYGVVVTSALTSEGMPWLLGTEEVYRQWRTLIGEAPAAFGRMRDSCRRLANVVSAENVRAIRLLERWGFTVERDAVDLGGVAMRHFWKEFR